MRGLIDSTLREGEQQPGVYFTTEQKVRIVEALVSSGIDEIELGVGDADGDLREVMATARSLGVTSRLALWCRFRADDIALAASLRPDVLSIALPVSDLHLQKRLGKDREWALSEIGRIVPGARRAGIEYVSIGLEDATRASIPFLDLIVEECVCMGVERIRLCDTLGIATPEQISSLVKRYASWGTLEIAVHTHDDFGMATANAVSALDAGAHWADGSVLGLGERAGIAQLEVIAAFFNLQRSWKHYDLIRIRKLADLVAHSVGETLGRRHPVFGRGLFECESGIHLDGLAKNAAAYEPFPAEAVGSERRIFIGMKAGFGAVVSAAKRMNVELDKTSASYLRASVRARSRALGRPLTDSEFAVLACEPR